MDKTPSPRFVTAVQRIGLITIAMSALGSAGWAQPAEQQVACELANGQWLREGRFVLTTLYSVDGELVRQRPAPVDCVIDLGGGFVVPPYAEAHKHDLNEVASVDEQSRQYMDKGVFYVMEQDPIFAITEELRAHVNRPRTVDVVYTEGVVAPSWSFIADLYRSFADAGRFGDGASLESINGSRLFMIDERGDLDRWWPAIEAQNTDFVKVIVAFSEEFVERRKNPDFPGTSKPGLDPSLLGPLVERAHEAGLRVSVHIETAVDFRLAVRAGADIVAHMPASWQVGESAGYPEGDLDPWLLTAEDARAAAEQGTVVVTTTVPFNPADPSADTFAEIHRHNLSVLSAHGVTLALGSDGGVGTANHEVKYIAGLDVFDNATLVRLLTEATPTVIFPDRRIGRLEEGYEASFLVLEENPLEDLANLDRITMRFKRGIALDP